MHEINGVKYTNWQLRKMTPEQRFFVKVNPNGPIPDLKPELGPCWLWTGGIKRPCGRAFFSINNKNVFAARWSYEHFKGRLKEDEFACHHCDNPACVNPIHMFAGDNTENVRDMWKKGRENAWGRHRPGKPRTVGKKSA